MITDLLTALQTAFNSNTALSTQFPDGLYLGRGPDATATPFCVVDVIGSRYEFHCSAPAELAYCLTTYRLQFSVYSVSDTTVATALGNLHACFDFASLTIPSGNQCVDVRPAGGGDRFLMEDNKVWNGSIDYEIALVDSLTR